MRRRKVLEFAAQVLEREGALVEPSGEDAIEVVLPDRLRQNLETGEFSILTDGEGEGQACGYGTEILGRIVRIAICGGRVAAFRADLPSSPPRKPESVIGLNLTFRVLQTWSEWGWILVGCARYRASCDDQREGFVQGAVTAPAGMPVPVPDFGAIPLEKISLQQLPQGVLRPAYPALTGVLRRITLENLEGFRNAVSRRHGRDIERIRRYFNDAARDLRRRLGNRNAPLLQGKLDALPGELQRRLNQLEADCVLRVRLEMVGLLAINGPGVTAELEVKRRKHRRILQARYDGIGRRWMGLRCDGCGSAALAFAMCDEAKHVLCSACWDFCGSGGHRPCFRCQGKPARCLWSAGWDEASHKGLE